MSLDIILTLICLLFVAVIFSTINSNLSERKSKTIWRESVLAISKVLSSIAIGLIIAAVPIVILLNQIKPPPEDVMPAFIYVGEISDDMDCSLMESLIVEYTAAIEDFPTASIYFDRAYLYFKTNNLDLAVTDLQKCIDLENNWMYHYDIGVVYGYLLDYPSSIQSFKTALSMDIPISERGLVISTLTMIEGYWDVWIYSLIK